MVREGVGRLPVVARSNPRKPIGMVTRSDLLVAHKRRLEELDIAEQHLAFRVRRRPAANADQAPAEPQGRARTRNIV
jgi:predicted transcriptional regulator